ncbi:MAG: acetylglutamate kinase [Alphaproteobacteria bacterium]|nr:acetylglutamate kinase [Alphaproteobacteria bacterium SS10]
MKDMDPLAKARVLSEALPYMRRYAKRTFVVKYGGSTMGDVELGDQFARDIVLLKQIGIHPVVVHGGGPQIGKMLDRVGIESEFVDGLRVTDKAAVDVVEMVLAGSINKQVVASINAAGGKAVGICGKDGTMIRAERLRRTTRDTDSNIEKIMDLGFVGEPAQVDPEILSIFERSNLIPVIAPIGIGPEGETLNINADTAAGAVAGAIGAARLLLLTDVPGVLDQDKKLIKQMTISEARSYIKDGTISGGMIPKIETCIASIEAGGEAAVILDGRTPHTLLLEIFTEGGSGTLIVRD